MKEAELKNLLESLSLEEKIGQLVQLMANFYQESIESIITGPAQELGIGETDIRLAGSILSSYGAKALKKMQDEYMEKHPHHIPMLFMADVIHGMKTIFPMPLAMGATFAPELAERAAEVSAKEASACGLHVTFSPMVDLVRDARWGRVMESTGEDPYLNSLFAAAQVKGFQGDDMSKKGKLCSCVKHFAGYGGPVAGREYNTVELSEHTFREFYLKAYKAGIDAGAGMVMTSFNTVNGIPASVNRWLMRNVLREEMGFDGVLISDYAALYETLAHGVCADEKEAAKLAMEAGVDIDMMTSVYATNLKKLIQEKKLDEKLLDESVMRVLELKNKLGLFENPYKDADEAEEREIILCEEHRNLAREIAQKSFVLLKNDGILPVKTDEKVAFVGPYVNCRQMNSSWAVTGDVRDCVTIREAALEIFDSSKTMYAEGSPILDPESDLAKFIDPANNTAVDCKEMLNEAVEAAKNADLVIMALGEHYSQTGEGASCAEIGLPEIQMQLFREILKVNKNVAVVLINGRPLDLREISKNAKAVLEVWRPGTEAGHAIIDVLTGKVDPSGKLPMSFPYCVGQVPVYYNGYSTGRPDIPGEKGRYRSNYLDIPNAPLYPFGYGLSYTEFSISDVELSSSVMTEKEEIEAKVRVTNIGNRSGTETMQLYIRDIVGSVVRPVKELKGVEKVELEPGEGKDVIFKIEEPMLRFLRKDGTVGSETGEFQVWVSNSSENGKYKSFQLLLN